MLLVVYISQVLCRSPVLIHEFLNNGKAMEDVLRNEVFWVVREKLPSRLWMRKADHNETLPAIFHKSVLLVIANPFQSAERRITVVKVVSRGVKPLPSNSAG